MKFLQMAPSRSRAASWLASEAQAVNEIDSRVEEAQEELKRLLATQRLIHERMRELEMSLEGEVPFARLELNPFARIWGIAILIAAIFTVPILIFESRYPWITAVPICVGFLAAVLGEIVDVVRRSAYKKS